MQLCRYIKEVAPQHSIHEHTGNKHVGSLPRSQWNTRHLASHIAYYTSRWRMPRYCPHFGTSVTSYCYFPLGMVRSASSLSLSSDIKVTLNLSLIFYSHLECILVHSSKSNLAIYHCSSFKESYLSCMMQGGYFPSTLGHLPPREARTKHDCCSGSHVDAYLHRPS